MRSSWNVDRSATARALRRADVIIGNRLKLRSDFGGAPDFAVTCHILPLGRVRSGDDRLAMAGHLVGDLVPPQFRDLPARFSNAGVEFYQKAESWKDRPVWLTWFRAGWAELHLQARAVKEHGGIEWLVRDTIPFLGRAAIETLKVDPPFVVSIRLDSRVVGLGLPRNPSISGVAFDGEMSRSVSPPSSIVSGDDLRDAWHARADHILNQLAQGYGRPSFERAPAPSEEHGAG
jgi:hypothetical protein